MKELSTVSDDYLMNNIKYLKLLSKQYPSISKASAEIINLEAILNLPKGTEHFLTHVQMAHILHVYHLKTFLFPLVDL